MDQCDGHTNTMYLETRFNLYLKTPQTAVIPHLEHQVEHPKVWSLLAQLCSELCGPDAFFGRQKLTDLGGINPPPLQMDSIKRFLTPSHTHFPNLSQLLARERGMWKKLGWAGAGRGYECSVRVEGGGDIIASWCRIEDEQERYNNQAAFTPDRQVGEIGGQGCQIRTHLQPIFPNKKGASKFLTGEPILSFRGITGDFDLVWIGPKINFFRIVGKE